MGEGNYPPGAKIEVDNDQFDPNSAGLKQQNFYASLTGKEPILG
jgi:hypothetical protein